MGILVVVGFDCGAFVCQEEVSVLFSRNGGKAAGRGESEEVGEVGCGAGIREAEFPFGQIVDAFNNPQDAAEVVGYIVDQAGRRVGGNDEQRDAESILIGRRAVG